MAKSLFDIIDEIFGAAAHAAEVDAAVDFVGDHMESVVASVDQGKAALKSKCKGCKKEAECLPGNLARIDDQAAAAKQIIEGIAAYRKATKGGQPLHEATNSADRKE